MIARNVLIISPLTALTLAAGCALGDDYANGRESIGAGLTSTSGVDTDTDADLDSSGDTGEPEPEPDPGQLARDTQDLFSARCAKCHGDGSSKAGGIDYITDLTSLVQHQKVIPGDPDASVIMSRLTSTDNPMPPVSEGPLDAEEIALIREWIDIGAPPAPDVASCEENDFISFDAAIEAMAEDLTFDVDPEDRRFTRYLTLTHLHNVGLCPEDIDVYRDATAKLINSLSRRPLLVRPHEIDGDGLILRIDLRDYGWDDNPVLAAQGFADAWEAIVVDNPLAVQFERGLADDLVADTETGVPFQSADALLYVTSRGDLYYDILEIPGDAATLEASFDLPSLADPDLLSGEIVRAAFKQSGVSNSNRLIERRVIQGSIFRAYWRSFDFAEEGGLGDLFTNPFDFAENGGEIIFNLENGMQGYMLVDADGLRVADAPTNIVQDPAQRDFIVKNGISCMSCHSAGIIPKEDEFLGFYSDNKNGFESAERDLIELLFLTNDELAGLQANDAANFAAAMEKVDVRVSDKEPIFAVYDRFEANLDLARAAAEFGLRPERLDQELAALAPELQLLRTHTVTREVFAEQYRDALCELLPVDGDVAPVCLQGQ